jgi:hypothetical protein
VTGAEARPVYTVRPVPADFRPDDPGAPWAAVEPLRIAHYLWLDNGYRPGVEAKLCRSPRFLHVRFRAAERRIKVRYLKFQDPVYKDSCVEFFFDAFPAKRLGYLNFETNAAGTLLAAFGTGRERRTPLSPEDLADFEAVSSVHGAVDGEHGADAWTLDYRLPLALVHKFYGDDIRPGHRARGNFYKCGDETGTPHFGAWSPVVAPTPDFHRPEFFGDLLFA